MQQNDMTLKVIRDFENNFGTSRNLNAIFEKFKLLGEPSGRYETCKARDLYLVKCLLFADKQSF